MGFFASFDVAASALAAQRRRIQVIAGNIAKIGATRDAQGRVNPPKHMVTIFRVGAPKITGSEELGVSVAEIVPSATPVKVVLDPKHPDADAKGFIRVADIKIPMEIADMMLASRAYEANITAIDTTRRLLAATLQIIA